MSELLEDDEQENEPSEISYAEYLHPARPRSLRLPAPGQGDRSTAGRSPGRTRRTVRTPPTCRGCAPVDARRRQRDQPAVLRPGHDVAEPVRQPGPARRGRHGVGVVHRLPDLADHPARRVVPRRAGRRGAVEGLRHDRHRRPPHRAGQARGRDLRVAVHAQRRRPLRPHQHPDRPGVRHRGRVPADVRHGDLVRRHDHRRRRARPHRQGRRLPARRDEGRGLPGHLPHGRDRPGGLEPAARRSRRGGTRSTSTPRPRSGWRRPATSSGACSG